MELANLILYCVVVVSGGIIGISRYSLEETGGADNFKSPLAHFVLTAAVSLVGGIGTKYLFSSDPEAIIAGGIIIAIIGHARVRGIFHRFVVKKLGLNGNSETNRIDDNHQ